MDAQRVGARPRRHLDVVDVTGDLVLPRRIAMRPVRARHEPHDLLLSVAQTARHGCIPLAPRRLHRLVGPADLRHAAPLGASLETPAPRQDAPPKVGDRRRAVAIAVLPVLSWLRTRRRPWRGGSATRRRSRRPAPGLTAKAPPSEAARAAMLCSPKPRCAPVLGRRRRRTPPGRARRRRQTSIDNRGGAGVADDVGERLAQHGQELFAHLGVDHVSIGPVEGDPRLEASRSPASEASFSTLARTPRSTWDRPGGRRSWCGCH